MSERVPDDTPKPADAPLTERGRQPGDYYYDDATGYEVYQPEEDEGISDRGRLERKRLTKEDAEGRANDEG